MGITCQSVQRIADLLVHQGLAEYLLNSSHRRAKLLRPTAEGLAAVRRIDPAHAVLAASRRRAGDGGVLPRWTRSAGCPARSTPSP